MFNVKYNDLIRALFRPFYPTELMLVVNDLKHMAFTWGTLGRVNQHTERSE